MTIFEALRHDHDIQRELANTLIRTHGETDRRDDLFVRLKDQLAAHADAEERHFYVPLMQHDLTQGPSRHGVAEHHDIEALVDELAQIDYSSPGWLVTAKKLHHLVHHHLTDEEHQIFQLAGKVLNERQKAALGSAYRSAMHTRLASAP